MYISFFYVEQFSTCIQTPRIKYGTFVLRILARLFLTPTSRFLGPARDLDAQPSNSIGDGRTVGWVTRWLGDV